MDDGDAPTLTSEQAQALHYTKVGCYCADIFVALVALAAFIVGQRLIAFAVLVSLVVIVPLSVPMVRAKRKQMLKANTNGTLAGLALRRGRRR